MIFKNFLTRCEDELRTTPLKHLILQVWKALLTIHYIWQIIYYIKLEIKDREVDLFFLYFCLHPRLFVHLFREKNDLGAQKEFEPISNKSWLWNQKIKCRTRALVIPLVSQHCTDATLVFVKRTENQISSGLERCNFIKSLSYSSVKPYMTQRPAKIPLTPVILCVFRWDYIETWPGHVCIDALLRSVTLWT